MALVSPMPAFFQKPLGLCSDIIPATVFELQLPQTCPDSEEGEKIGSTLLEKWQAGLVGVQEAQKAAFGRQMPPSIQRLGGNKATLLLHRQGGIVGPQTRPSGVQVSVSSHQLWSPESKIQGLGAVPTPVNWGSWYLEPVVPFGGSCQLAYMDYHLQCYCVFSLLFPRCGVTFLQEHVNRHLFTSDRIPTTVQRQAFTSVQLRKPVNHWPSL